MDKSYHFNRKAIFLVFLFLASLCGAIYSVHGEENNQWQSGAIIEVKAHQAQPGENSEANQYDISFKVGKKIYVVLFTRETTSADPEFYVGKERPVLIAGDVLKVNDILGRTHSLRILRSRNAPDEAAK